jgi:formate-dependent phosphoribosylglycinamide formyltransferase (GAR transformylase)
MTRRLTDPKQFIICDTLAKHCENLNEAHKDEAKHKRMIKTVRYQRYIGAMEQLNRLSRKFGYGCYCKDIPGPGNEHKGHRMVRR